MKKGKENKGFGKAYFVYLIFVIYAIVLVIYGWSAEENNGNGNDFEYIEKINSDWTVIDNNTKNIKQISLPYDGFEEDNNSITIVKNIGDIINSNVQKNYNSILLKSNFQNVIISVDGEIIEDYTNNNYSLYTKAPGEAWIFVDIPDDSKEIAITYENVHNVKREIGEVYIGNKFDLCVDFILDNILEAISSLFIFALASVVFMLWFFTKSMEENKKLLYLATYTYLLSFWTLLQCDIMQLFITKQEILHMISYELLMLLPIGLLFILRDDVKGFTKLALNVSMIFSVVVCIGLNVIQAFKLYDLREMIMIIHVSYGFAAVVVLCYSLSGLFNREKVSRKMKFNGISFSYFMFSITVFVDIFNYYEKWYSDVARFSRIGIFIFIVIIGVSIIRELYSLNIIVEKMELWDTYAHQDILTNVGNRVAFETELKAINKKRNDLTKVAIISFDVNNLKIINDQYGHGAGDDYLKECVKAIQSVIEEGTNIYRIGGDEFVLIVNGYESGQVMRYISKFEAILRNEDESKYKYQVSFAYGYAYYKPKIDSTIYDTLKRADKDMYDKKVEMKKRGVEIRL